MRFRATDLPGVLHVTPEVFDDERGSFMNVFSQADFEDNGQIFHPTQHSLSVNLRAGTLRGLHFQLAPEEQTKFVRCIRGAVFDVAVDVRLGSPTFGEWTTAILTARERNGLFIPEGFAHGFRTLEDNTEVLYLIEGAYTPSLERGIRWDDPTLAIDWPGPGDPVTSERDRHLPVLADASLPLARRAE